MLQQTIKPVLPYHRTADYQTDLEAQRMPKKQQHSASPPFIRHRKTLSFSHREKIREKLSFLEPYHNSIHSLVVVGSTAYDAQTSNSDLDIVIITTIGGHTKVCEFLFEKELDESLSSGKNSKLEYTVLSSEQTEKLFDVSSPFAYSIRHGVIIRDDGYLLVLRNKRFPLLPKKPYYMTCLYENIATPYYGMLKKLQSETKKKGCTSSCCRKSKGCEGLQPAHIFAKLIMQMFYVTLPSHGLIPLTKADVIIHAKKAYGSQGENVAKQIVSLLRDKRTSFCFDEFKMLKKFAVQLFKEILNIIGITSEVREIIADASRIAREDYHLIHNPVTKSCVI